MAEVRQIFKVPKIGTVAGCMVTDGSSAAPARPRHGCSATTSSSTRASSASLKRFKEDVGEVKTGFECGMSFERFQDLKLGDVIEVFTVERVAATVQ